MSARTFKIIVFLLCASPLAWNALSGVRNRLGANPVDRLLNNMGYWTLVLVTATLVPTALKIITGWKLPLKARRMLGLWAFTYGMLHGILYWVFEHELDLPAILEDIGKRSFILVGTSALVLMMPLALTSTTGWVQRLGGRRWQLLHRLVYVVAVLGVVHFWWRMKADKTWPATFGAVIGVLLIARLADRVRRAREAT